MEQAPRRGFIDYLLVTAKGMGMGAADVIPGVSGGTIAFIAGIYEELINSIRSVNLTAFKKLFSAGIPSFWSHVNGSFLVALLTGILISVFSLARVITYLLHNYPILVWAFFFGLILASTWFVAKKIKKLSWPATVAFILGIAVAYYITVAAPTHTPEALWFTFISGVIAICAMILPGISGSFILLLLGKYDYILDAVKSANIKVVAVFAAGCAIGLLLFSHVISWLFRKFHDLTIALLTGFMLGSLNKVWPWKRVLEFRVNSKGEQIPFLEESVSPFRFEQITGNDPMIVYASLIAILGFVLIFIFERFADQKSNKV